LPACNKAGRRSSLAYGTGVSRPCLDGPRTGSLKAITCAAFFGI